MEKNIEKSCKIQYNNKNYIKGGLNLEYCQKYSQELSEVLQQPKCLFQIHESLLLREAIGKKYLG